MAFTYVFKRVEKKYILNSQQYEYILDRISPYMHMDKYGESVVSNIYFDNYFDELIETSLEKPVYKEKLRLRSYGVPDDNTTVFLEIKKKYKSVVYKRRISLSLKEANEYIKTGALPTGLCGNIPSEIDFMMKRYNLVPRVYIGYNRAAYVCCDCPDLRITFDKNIRSRYDDINLEYGDSGKLLLDKGTYLMEIKIPDAMPLWLSHILSDKKIFSQSFSKYGQIHIQKRIQEAYKNV